MSDFKQPDIKIFGIGGAGCAIVDKYVLQPLIGAGCCLVDCDREVLENSICKSRVALSSQSSEEEIENALRPKVEGCKIIIIVSGFGGDTGTKIAPVLARVAKESGCVTIAYITIPFKFEGESRLENFLRGVENLKPYADTIVFVENEKVKTFPLMLDDFNFMRKEINAFIVESIRTIAYAVCEPNIVNVSLDEVLNVLKDGGLAYFGVGVGECVGAYPDAAKIATNNALSYLTLAETKKIMICLSCGENVSLKEINDIVEVIRGEFPANTQAVCCVRKDQYIQGEMHISIIGTSGLNGKSYNKAEDKKETGSICEIDRQSFSENMQAVFNKASEIAKKYDSAYLSTEHFVFAMLSTDCKAGDILRSCGVNISLYEVFFKHTISPSVAITSITPKMNGCLQRAKESSENSGEQGIGSSSVLFAILNTDCQAVNILKALGANIKELIQQLETNA